VADVEHTHEHDPLCDDDGWDHTGPCVQEFVRGDHCTSPELPGVALVFLHLEEEQYLPEMPEHECQYDEWDTAVCEECAAWGSDPEDWATAYTGQAVVQMVGDDTNRTVSPDSLVKLEENVCSCGQLGCSWF
jgi:hypothetical protein